MRVLFSKFHCPSFICFCKPYSAHNYTPGPLKLENTPYVLSTVIDTSDQTIEGKEEILEAENGLRSCIKKVPPELKEGENKRVQWMDHLGKQLFETKEFESSETEDSDNEESHRGCCIIL